jgi:hypothetical protein
MMDIVQKAKQLRRDLRSYFFDSNDLNPIPVDDLFTVPEVKERGPDWEHRGNYFRRTLMITDLPEVIDPPWFGRVLYKLPQRVSIGSNCIEPYDNGIVQENLVERMSHTLSKENALRHRGLRERFETESLAKSTSELFERNSDKSYFKLGMYFEIHTSTKYELEAMTDYVHSIAESENFELTSVKYRHVESLRTMSPTSVDEINYNIIVDLETLSLLMLPTFYTPFTINRDK